MHVTVIAPFSTDGIHSDDEVNSLYENDLTVSVVSLGAGPLSIESRVDEAFAVPGMITVALEAEKNGANALVVDCMGDPGLGALREAVDIRVLGVAETSMAQCNKPFGVVAPLDRIEPMLKELVTCYGHGDQYAGCRWVDIPVLDIHKRMDEVREGLAERALELVREEGAASIILGCAALMGCAEAISKKLQEEGFDEVLVVDPLPTTVSYAATAIREDLTCYSRKDFPKCERKHYTGYEFLTNR